MGIKRRSDEEQIMTKKKKKKKRKTKQNATYETTDALTKKNCNKGRLKLACASTQFDHCVRCPHEETLHPWFSKMHPVMIQIRLRECAGWSESSLGVHVRRYLSWHCGSITLMIHFRSLRFIYLPYGDWILRGDWRLSTSVSKGDNVCHSVCAPANQTLSETGSTLKGKDLLPSKFFPFRADPFSERRLNIFGRGVIYESMSIPVNYWVTLTPHHNSPNIWVNTLYYHAVLKGSILLKHRHFIIQERFNKLIYGINTNIEWSTWQPVKFQLVSCSWNEMIFIVSLN